MGRNKMMLELEGEPLVRRAARSALEGGLDPLVVVIGHEPERVRHALRDLPCLFAENPHYRGATSSSLHRGLSSLPEDAAGAVILLADMPRVTGEMLIAVGTAAGEPGAYLVISRYGDVIAPPFYFSRALFPELLAWSGGGAGKGIATRHQAQAQVLAWPPEALQDIDTEDDFASFA